MSILDQALQMYINEKVKNAPKRNFEMVVQNETDYLLELCRKAGFDSRSYDIVNHVILPWFDKVREEMSKLNE